MSGGGCWTISNLITSVGAEDYASEGCGNANLHGNWQEFQAVFRISKGKGMGVFKIAFPIVHRSGQSQLSFGLCQNYQNNNNKNNNKYF